MAKSGASKGAKKINAFNDGKLEGVNVSQFIGPRPDTHLPSDGPGSLLDKNLIDHGKPDGGYPSDDDGSIPLVKKKKTQKSRKA